MEKKFNMNDKKYTQLIKFLNPGCVLFSLGYMNFFTRLGADECFVRVWRGFGMFYESTDFGAGLVIFCISMEGVSASFMNVRNHPKLTLQIIVLKLWRGFSLVLRTSHKIFRDYLKLTLQITPYLKCEY